MSTFNNNRQDYPNKETLSSKFRPDDTDDANNENLLSTLKQTQLIPSDHPQL
jgi:hypothetical protein